jgi:hypothetical protein
MDVPLRLCEAEREGLLRFLEDLHALAELETLSMPARLLAVSGAISEALGGRVAKADALVVSEILGLDRN